MQTIEGKLRVIGKIQKLSLIAKVKLLKVKILYLTGYNGDVL